MREQWIDVAKGIGIVMVVTQHFLGGELGEWILMFHMPLFFFLSGLVFYPERYNTYYSFWRNKIFCRIKTYIKVAIPLVLFSGGGYIVKGDYIEIVRICFYVLLQKRVWTIWFLACLTVTEIISYVLYKIDEDLLSQFIGSIILFFIGICYAKMIGYPLPWNIDVAFIAIFYFTIGRIFMHYHCIEWVKKCKRRVLYGSLAFLIVEFIRKQNNTLGGSFLDMGGGCYKIEWLTIPASLIGILGIVWLSELKALSVFRLVGFHSLYIFAWHNTIFRPILERIFDICKLDNTKTSSIIAKIFLVILLGVLLGEAISRKYLRRLVKL